ESNRENDRRVLQRRGRPLLEVQPNVDWGNLGVFLHKLNELSYRHQGSLARIELKLVGDRDEVVARHGSLFDGLDALLGGIRYGRPHKIRRDLLRLNQDLGLREIGCGPQEGSSDTADRKDQERTCKERPSPFEN